jgi:geranylgeranyl diphosphate synthase, type I
MDPAEPAAGLCDRVRERIDDVLADFLDAQLETLADDAGQPIFSPVKDFVLHGGKRIRPLLCYWGWRGADGDDCTEILKAASALEIFHAFCLVHDDIMDDSDLRRGRPTLHRILEEQHANARWRGGSRQFGIAAAILLGDLCMAWADELLHASGLEPHHHDAIRRYYHRMRTEVFYGQHLDIVEQARGPTSPERSMTVVRYKSAKYTVERPLQLGGALAGAYPSLLSAYSAFGLAIGEAFQLRDDILGAFGDPAATGKSNLDDFRYGKPTVLIAQATMQANAAQRRVIDTLYGDRGIGDAEGARLREVIAETGALAAVEKMIAERGELAMATLATAPIQQPTRQALTELATAALHRSN